MIESTQPQKKVEKKDEKKKKPKTNEMARFRGVLNSLKNDPAAPGIKA
jgi:hypothetical protein